MSLDIQHVLHSWPFKPGEINVRRILGDDGREKIQLRLDLGVLQMEVSGRPDGKRPHGCESLLEHHEGELLRAEGGGDFCLSARDCEALRAEGVMYYHRYLAAFVLGDFESVEADTARNLRLFDLCSAYAEEEHDRTVLEQYRPYVLMMHTRARARKALKQNRHAEAMEAVREGLRDIGDAYAHFDTEDPAPVSTEMAVLEALGREIQALTPQDAAARLRKQLQQAIEEERYEDAARLRDQIDRAQKAEQGSE
jgi:hypothetical protein